MYATLHIMTDFGLLPPPPKKKRKKKGFVLSRPTDRPRPFGPDPGPPLKKKKKKEKKNCFRPQIGLILNNKYGGSQRSFGWKK